MATKKALIVRGGWDGHHPVESTELFIPFLRENGYDVRIEDSPQAYTPMKPRWRRSTSSCSASR